MRKILIATYIVSLSVLSHAASTSSQNNTFSYNFIEGQYVDLRTELDLNDSAKGPRRHGRGDVDGFRIAGSFDVAPSFSVIGSLLDAGGDHDLSIITAGAAYHQPLTKIEQMPLDLLVRVEIEHVEYEGFFYSVPKGRWFSEDDDETGILVSGGVQMQIIDKLQAYSLLSISSNDVYRDISLAAGARYEFVKGLEATAAVEIGDVDILSTGLRYNF